MISIMKRIFKQLLNDKRSLALILFAPILIMSLSYLVFGDTAYTPNVGLMDIPTVMSSAISDTNLNVTIVDSMDDSYLQDGTYDAYIYLDSGQLAVRMLELNSTKYRLIMTEVQSAMTTLNPTSSTIDVTYVYGGESESTFDSIGYILLGVSSFFFVFIIAGVSFVRERTIGTMERFMLAPIARYKVVLGVLLGFGLFAIIQSIIVILFVHYVLGLMIASNVLYVIFVMTVLALVAVAFGALISTFAENEFQVAQFIPVVVVPQIFLSGLIPIETIPLGLGNLAYITPVYYACDALDKLMIRGTLDIGLDLLVLFGFIVVFFIINTLLLKKYRQI